MVRRQAHVRLLLPVWADECVNFCGLDVPKFLHSICDLPLVCTDVNEENESVVFLDLLHGGLCVEGGGDDAELIHAGGMGDGTTLVLGVAFEAESAGAMEGDRCACLALHGCVC